MAPCKLKCSYKSFSYFMLQINEIADVKHVASKFSNLKKLGEQTNHIVLNFSQQLDPNTISKMVLDIYDMANNHDLLIHAIVKNDNIASDSFSGIPVVELPDKQQTKPIEELNKTLLYSEPVRSGIQVKNDGDIIITNFVSNNAEIIATGNIHIYGEARGRLVAGSGGDKNARIFVTKFNPELISIGGIFRALEDQLPEGILNKSVMVSLDDKSHLNIVRL